MCVSLSLLGGMWEVCEEITDPRSLRVSNFSSVRRDDSLGEMKRLTICHRDLPQTGEGSSSTKKPS